MQHPSQLNIFAQPQTNKAEIPKPKLEDFSHWREGDLLDLLELICTLMQSDEWQSQGNTRMLMQRSLECNLPSSITTMLLNTLPKLESLLGLQVNDCEFKPDATQLPNVASLAKWCGLGGVFTKEVDAIWKGKAEALPAMPTIEQPQEIEQLQAPKTTIEQPQYFEARITTNVIADGRQWKIGGQLISEVLHYPGLGHVGKLYSGDFVTQTKPYREYEPAATQCRNHVEGILKFLKTIPR